MTSVTRTSIVHKLALLDMLLIRFHDSGDWHSYHQAKAECKAMSERRWALGFKYTKNIKWLARLREEGLLPENFRVVQSVGGWQDHLIDENFPHAKVFSTHEERIAAGYEDGTETDIPAIEGVIKIGLVYHGTEKITELDQPNLQQRGGIKALSPGVWKVTVPLGIKNRKNVEFEFNFSGIADCYLAAEVSLKTGNRKVVKTAKELGERHGRRYHPAAISIPALASCPQAKDCTGFCYAMQGFFIMTTHAKKRALLWALHHEARRRGILEQVIGQQLDAAVPHRMRKQWGLV